VVSQPPPRKLHRVKKKPWHALFCTRNGIVTTLPSGRDTAMAFGKTL
jgi:hypothetical protein